MIDLAMALVDGEIARKKGDLATAVLRFRQGAELERKLGYSEPPWWHQPVSHLLGAALIEAHKPAEAEAVYRDSLNFYRVDGWALFGLAQAQRAEGKTAGAADTLKEFHRAWSLADVTLTSSRF
jgi:hypothetical protein